MMDGSCMRCRVEVWRRYHYAFDASTVHSEQTGTCAHPKGPESDVVLYDGRAAVDFPDQTHHLSRYRRPGCGVTRKQQAPSARLMMPSTDSMFGFVVVKLWM